MAGGSGEALATSSGSSGTKTRTALGRPTRRGVLVCPGMLRWASPARSERGGGGRNPRVDTTPKGELTARVERDQGNVWRGARAVAGAPGLKRSLRARGDGPLGPRDRASPARSQRGPAPRRRSRPTSRDEQEHKRAHTSPRGPPLAKLPRHSRHRLCRPGPLGCSRGGPADGRAHASRTDPAPRPAAVDRRGWGQRGHPPRDCPGACVAGAGSGGTASDCFFSTPTWSARGLI
jgi:hypothetical protein